MLCDPFSATLFSLSHLKMSALNASSDAMPPGKDEPDTQPADFQSDDDDEFEDPAQAWIALVEACHIADLNTRKKEVQLMIFHAKNSHWTGELYDSELELLNDEVSVEYGGPADAHTLNARTKVTARANTYMCPVCYEHFYNCKDYTVHRARYMH